MKAEWRRSGPQSSFIHTSGGPLPGTHAVRHRNATRGRMGPANGSLPGCAGVFVGAEATAH